MKILNLCNTQQYYKQDVTNSNIKFKQLRKDTVSFGYLFKKVDPSIQLYRSIGEKEYKELLSGKPVYGSYTTTDPRGWEAQNWNSGYINSDNTNTYFITYKTNRFKHIIDARDSESDTRYKIAQSYSLDDVENIRKGNNIHGELVYAEDFKSAKEEDIKIKKKEIEKLLLKLQSSKNEQEKGEIWDNLISYVQEFPDILNLVEDIVDFGSEEDIYGYSTMITKLDSGEHMSKYRKCLKAYVDGEITPSADFSYLVKYCEKEDLNDIMALINKGKIYSNPASKILEKLESEEFITNNMLQSNIIKLEILYNYLSRKNNKEGYLSLYMDIIDKLQSINVPPYDYALEYRVDMLMNKCNDILDSKKA